MKVQPWELMGQLWHLLQEVNAGASPAFEPLGLNQKEFWVLHSLLTHPTPSKVAEVTLFPAATITDVVKRLESLGYVERKIDLADLRRHRLDITASGKKALKYGTRAVEKRFIERLERLNHEEQVVFAKLAARLNEAPVTSNEPSVKPRIPRK